MWLGCVVQQEGLGKDRCCRGADFKDYRGPAAFIGRGVAKIGRVEMFREKKGEEEEEEAAGGKERRGGSVPARKGAMAVVCSHTQALCWCDVVCLCRAGGAGGREVRERGAAHQPAATRPRLCTSEKEATPAHVSSSCCCCCYCCCVVLSYGPTDGLCAVHGGGLVRIFRQWWWATCFGPSLAR